MDGNVIELKNVTKRFPGVVALDDMSLSLRCGEIRGLIGENGAGKSTLIKILTGVYQPDEGELLRDGQAYSFKGPADAKAVGIACVYQELNIVKELSITDNMFLGNYIKNKTGLLDYKTMNQKTEEIMASMNQPIEAGEITGNLGMGQQQMIEIGKAILLDAQVLILDEPTSSLGEKEAEELFRTVRLLKEKGLAILFVSHKLEEIFELCDDVTVMRDGKHIITSPSAEMTKDSLIEYMVGRSLDNLYPKGKVKQGDVALEVKNLTRIGEYYNINFKAHRGEIVGFAGLVGAGRTELMRGIFAADLPDSGEIYINGEKRNITSPKAAIDNKIAFLTEDRKQQGLVLTETIEKNLTLVNIDQLKTGVFINTPVIKQQAVELVERLRIRTPTPEKLVGELSGGNQQKVVIGKWVVTDAEIYIFDEPTRGIDVGAKIEVYNVINELVSQGKCVLLISSELQEILGMCDRVIVMREGYQKGEVERGSDYFDQESIMKAAWGGDIYE